MELKEAAVNAGFAVSISSRRASAEGRLLAHTSDR
jgi:hypothetical protein